MPRAKKYRDVIRVVEENGWVFIRQGKGSHELWGKPDGSVSEPIPHHREVTAGIIGKLIVTSDHTPANWR